MGLLAVGSCGSKVKLQVVLRAKVRKVHPTDMDSSQCLEIRIHQKRLYINLQEL